MEPGGQTVGTGLCLSLSSSATPAPGVALNPRNQTGLRDGFCLAGEEQPCANQSKGWVGCSAAVLICESYYHWQKVRKVLLWHFQVRKMFL